MTTYLLPALALTAAFAGYGTLLWNRIRLEFIPITVFASLTCALYLGALAGLLGQAALSVLIIGGVLLARAVALLIKRRARPNLRALLCPGAVFFALACAALCFMTRGARFIHYDNFSHWGLMVKHLALTDRLPGAGDLYIAFRQYPPGSALFIYLFTYAFGYSESIAILAQGIFMAGAVTCLFASVRGWRSALPIALIVFYAANCKSYLTYSLLVDTLLPLVAVGGALIILHYRDDMRKAALLSLPVMTVTLLIKNSGAFYAAINCALMLLCLIRSRRLWKRQGAPDRRAAGAVAMSIALSMLMLAVWFVHAHFAFRDAPPVPNTKTEQSQVDLSSGPKTKDVQGVTSRLTEYIFSAKKGSPLMQTLSWSGLVLAALILSSASARKLNRALLFAFAAGLSMSALYIFGEYLLYLYIMPDSASDTLSGIGRYTYALFTYLAGLYVAVVAEEWLNGVDIKRPATALIAACCVAALCALAFDPAMFMNKPKYEGSLVQAVDEAFAGVQTDGKRFVVYLPGGRDASLCKYIVRYKLMDPTSTILTEAEDIPAALENGAELIEVVY